MTALAAFGGGLTNQATAQQVQWKLNPVSGKQVGLTYGATTWAIAQSIATNYAGNLVTIRDQADRDWLVNNFSSSWSVAANQGPWIGYTDQVLEGTWRWISGSTSTYTNWAAGEPNGGANDDWAYFTFVSGAWRWADWNATAVSRALIEADRLPPTGWSWPTAYGTNARPMYGVLDDVNSDGKLDYISANRDAGTVQVFRNNTVPATSSPVFTEVQQIVNCGQVHALLTIDIDFDGDKDLIGTDLSGNRVFQLIRDSQGFYGVPTTLLAVPGAHGLARGDVNNDGFVDLVVSSVDADDRVRIYLRTAQGGFNASASQTLGPIVGDARQPVLGDLTGDGNLDLLVAGQTGTAYFVGGVNGQFTGNGILPGTDAYNAAVVDMEFDGDLDVVVPDFSTDTVRLLRNNGTGQLTTVQQVSCGDGPRWVEIGDVNGDGLPDCVVGADISDTVHVLLNTGLNPGQASHTFVGDHNLVGQDLPIRIMLGDLNRDAKNDIITVCHQANSFTVHINQSFYDCNGNSVEDAVDIATAAATDCDGNRIPDTCDLINQTLDDCNFNQIVDICEIQSGLMTDCNGNLRSDVCDVSSGLSQDVNLDGIPDECSLDCNANGLWDVYEVSSGLVPDCNGNGIPDSCDIATTSRDQNFDSIPDECQPLGLVRCSGDGTGTPCPCGNVGGSGRGCPSSANVNGAQLRAIGDASFAADTVMLIGSGMSPAAVGLYIQGTTAAGVGGNGTVFGDGLRCASGVVIRLGIKTAVGGSSEYPRANDQLISVKGQIPAQGATRIYQLWYRDAVPFCSVSTFNLTNGVQITWTP